MLDQFCFSCHTGGASKGGIAFDAAEPLALFEKREIWSKSLKMLRADLMPPKGKPRPSPEQTAQIANWIKTASFKIDPRNADPGRATIRRLNRNEYRNTIRDLLGVQFDVDGEFPPDDTGHGFDNISDVLTISPLLLEKYIAAARSIVSKAVPAEGFVVAEKRIGGRRFSRSDGAAMGAGGDDPLSLSYYKPAAISSFHSVGSAGRYQLVVDVTANETFVDGVFDYNKCRLLFKADGRTLHSQEYTRQGGKRYRYQFDQDWKPGKHELSFELQPLTQGEKQVRSLTMRIVAVTVRGPMAKEHWVRPTDYERFFPNTVPNVPAERREVARVLLTNFADRAFRRPVDEETIDRLARIAERQYTVAGGTFEAGVGQAMTIILASPRFLFREEGVSPSPVGLHPFVDEYALASRLSYFLWSTMPDEELLRLARKNELRKNLSSQIARMSADLRSSEFIRNFVGQWLQARSIETIPINALAVTARDEAPDSNADKQRARFRELARKPAEALTAVEKKELDKARATFSASRRRNRFDLTSDLRRSMRRETEMLFEHIVRKDRSLLELIDGDYTFLNERLAKHYGIDGVAGDQMRLVKLPADSPRGGVLTQGTVLAVTSNPDRTSPVKRGLFILENILGVPPPPAPPDIPPLEDSATAVSGRPATLRETLKVHRNAVLCSSCHNRMDPLGLGFENFNALGRWRDKERLQPIDAAGRLVTGESFTNIRELKHILATGRRQDFYRCLTEKLLIYALGRGLEYSDVQTVDEIVERLEKTNGRPSALLTGVIESAPFQKRRAAPAIEARATAENIQRPTR